MDRALYDPLDRAAARSPDHPALRYGGAQMTYGELSERSDRLAAVLRDQGVRPGDRVAIHADKGLAAGTAIYGIMKAGAAYVPLDPKSPSARQAFILADCGIRHLVTEPGREKALESLAREDSPVESVVGFSEIGTRQDWRFVSWDEVATTPPIPERLAGLEELSYVLYTSGSTGTPKGVAHTHRSALAFAEIAADAFGFRPEDRLSNHAPLHFDLSTMDYFSAAVAGATTVIIPEIYTKLPASLTQLIETEGVSVLYMVPLALTHLLLHGALDQRDVSTVRWVLFGGEPFPTRHLRDLMDAMPGARFSNVYGPTEVNGVTFWPVPALDPDDDAPISIGEPFDGVEILILDGDEPVQDGEAGELVAVTPTMMHGYWNRPDLDARGFWSAPDGRTGYRTGDLVRRRPDGLLDFLGRIDRQIKARGYRIELDEIEVAMLSHDAVAAGAAFGVRDPQGSQHVEAAVTVREGHALDEEEVRAHVAQFLPPYMVPEQVEVLDRMPKTSSGKIDRVELARRAASRNALSPKNET